MSNERQRDPGAMPAYGILREELEQCRLGLDPSELHGSLCGYFCAGGEAGRDDWLQRLALQVDTDADVTRRASLRALFEVTAAQLAEDCAELQPLLPDDDAPLPERAEAMLAWCRSFLGGFGLAAGAEPRLSPEAEEALEDLAHIAASSLSYEDEQADEEALTEVLEFVRVAAMLLHSDCNRSPRESVH